MYTIRPENECQRINKLKEYLILDTLPEQAYGDIVSLAAQLCGVPCALLTLADSNREWPKANKCLVANENSRDGGLYAQTILQQDGLSVSNADNDSRFSANVPVTSRRDC